MRTNDLEFEYNERSDGYIYVNEDNLEEETKKILSAGHNVERLEIGKEISRDAYLCLSQKRKNVLKWYPWDEDASLLEIGAGYGEFSDYLCKHLRKVMSYERKAERLEVIKLRCREFENLQCCTGNLEDLKFSEQYDYILVHDVFALARKFFKGKNPNVSMLNFLKQYLKENGKLILVVENRLGLKYFAGAAEDYSQQFFWGLKSFDEDERARTFSKTELKEILQDSGFNSQKWFYPYPDAICALEIYSDAIREKMIYGISSPDYEYTSERFQFFDEQRMFYTLHKENMEDKFVNAFFVECSRNGHENNIAFANIENEICVTLSKDGFYVGEHRLPEGMRLDAYLAGLVQKVVNCNLGDKNPYIPKVYEVFESIYSYLGNDIYYLEDFYCLEGKVTPFFAEHEVEHTKDYYIWRIGYLWYLNNIMFYRNAKRRIRLEKIMEILHVESRKIPEYLSILEKEKKKTFMPRLSQMMFDFEAENAKDGVLLDVDQIGKETLVEKLAVLHGRTAGSGS
ncbi:MAG: class I SAM-dependent methyltransferase [Roseburia sp.]|nr:class I SAM-dependent methyltransferase [Roseburia sp.]